MEALLPEVQVDPEIPFEPTSVRLMEQLDQATFPRVALGLAGNPFHAGAPWRGMEVGLKATSGLMAK